MDYRSIIVHYNGQWDNLYNYIGGDERVVMIPSHDITLEELQRNVQYIIHSHAMVGSYTLYYLAETRSERTVPSVLATNMLLQRLCNMYWEPNVYLVMNMQSDGGAGGSRQQQSPYRPHNPYSPTPEELHRFSSSMMFGEGSSGSRSSPVPDLNNNAPDDESDEDDEFGAHQQNLNIVVESDDEEAEFDTDSSDGDERQTYNASLFNCTIEDFTAWVREQGGMGAIVSSLLPANPLPAETIEGLSGQMNNWLLPIIPVDTSDSPVVPDLQEVLEGELEKGKMFWRKEDLYVAVGLWHMEHHVEFKVTRSSTTRVVYNCSRNPNCTFILRASNAAGCWVVREFIPTHSCTLSLNNIRSRTIRSKAISAYFARRMRRQGSIIKPRDIMAELQQSFGIKVSYSNALRARNGAISMIYGGLEESFNLLPKYLDVLQKWNPGTITDMDIGEDQRLRHFFVALSVSRAAFVTCLRQVIVVDATHLKGRNKGVLLVAVTKDGNEQIFPLAIGFAPIENDESWTWFMSRLRMAFDCSPHLLIVSDQHISIAKAVSSVYPEATHALCGYHIQNKLTTFNATIVKLYHKAAYAYRSIVYQKAMDQIQEHCPTAYNKLMTVGPEKWARCKCPVRRYSFMTSNAAEVFNSRLLDARRLPICSIIELYRHIVEKWFDERRAKAFARDDDVTQEVVAKMTPLADISHNYTVSPVSEYHFKVKHNDRTWKVDLQDSLCDCREFQMDLIPCSHAIAAIRFKGLGVYDYVWEYYKTSNWRETYGGTVHPLPPRDEWIVSPEAQACVVLPPIINRQAGRPRNSRRPSGAEAGQTSTSRRRAPKKCSICGSSSHTKRACPERIPPN